MGCRPQDAAWIVGASQGTWESIGQSRTQRIKLQALFSFSLEGLAGGAGVGNKPCPSREASSANTTDLRHPLSSEERGGSLGSLSEEDLESGQREHRRVVESQVRL